MSYVKFRKSRRQDIMIWALSTLLAFCEEFTSHGGFPHKGPAMQRFDVFVDVSLNRLFNEQPAVAYLRYVNVHVASLLLC